MTMNNRNGVSTRLISKLKSSITKKKSSKTLFVSTISTIRREEYSDHGPATEKKKKMMIKPTVTTPAAANGEVEIMSAEQRLRADMLRSRFADTILRAAQKLHGEKSQDARLVEKRIKMDAQELEERSKRRERERVARENMKKTVEFNDQNRDVMEQLATWGCGRRWDGVSPLKRLGLFIKPDDFDYIERDPDRVDAVLPMDDDYEEGEIVS